MVVITISKAPMSLRGDLTKWMQEIATGVYIGDLNCRVREELWKRVVQNVGKGQATISYTARNELGYQFKTHRTMQINISFDGIPLVMVPQNGKSKYKSEELKEGFSNQARYRQARKYASRRVATAPLLPYIVLDIETTGLDLVQDDIIEIAALKIEPDNQTEFHRYIYCENKLPEEITELTGITREMLVKKGQGISQVLDDLIDFIGEMPIVGYNLYFDIGFINYSLGRMGKRMIRNRKIDLMGLVKKEKMFLKSYKLQDVLLAYDINKRVLHRAQEDARLTYILSTKVNGFAKQLNRKRD